MKSIVRLCAALSAVASLVALVGCESQQKKVVAEINNETITDDVYYDRVLNVVSVPQELSTDAGGLTMINMIRDKLTEQLAAKYHAVPSDEMVSAAADYMLHMDPKTASDVSAGRLSSEELRRQKKFELEAFGIGTNGDKAPDQEIDKLYQEYKDKPDFKVHATYTVKILAVPTADAARSIIAFLKQTGDFKGAAEKILGMPPAASASETKEQSLVADRILPELKAALDKLKVNEITPEPIALKIAPDPQQPLNTETRYAVAQLKKLEPERSLSMTEIRYLLSPIVLQKTHPDWKEHYRHELAAFTKTSQIRVALAKYAPLVDTFVRPLANAESSGQPTTGLQTPQPGSLQ